MAADKLLSLDVGERRIGVAVADTAIRIAVAQGAIDVDGSELDQIVKAVSLEGASTVVIGYPRNQKGEATAQTRYVEQFSERLRTHDGFRAEIVFQDESLTSVLAEDQLKAHKKSYTRADIDATAARIILQDFIEERYG